jgi:hypothetical protein
MEMGIEITRREAIMAGMGLTLTGPLQASAAANEFWNLKKPQDWTDDERRELLIKSPWAKEPSTNYESGGAAAAGRGAVASRSSRTVRSNSTAPGSSGNPKVPDKFPSVVRWESALPIREANFNESKDDPAANYILKITGELPMLGLASDDETQDEYARRLDPLKQFTKLEKKGEPIYLTKIGFGGKGPDAGALFYFVRNDLITLDDKAVTLVTKLGPISVKVKFTLHDMIYQGKLEL